MTPADDRLTLPVGEARALAVAALRGGGLDERDADAIADHVVDAALSGYEYSGLSKVMSVFEDKRWRLPVTEIRVVHRTPVSLNIDAGNHNGMAAMAWATDAAIELARQSGIALVNVSNTWLSGRSAFFVERAADAGFVAMLTVAAQPRVAPPGAKAAGIGTNPIAFGFPTAGSPLVIDFGTSAYMDSNTQHSARMGRPLPTGVAFAADGTPTTDPLTALSGFLASDGHKGFALAIAIDALGALRYPHEASPGECECFLALFSPELFLTESEFRTAVSERIARVEALPRQEGVDEIRIPGRRSARERASRMVTGIEVDASVVASLKDLASRRS